MPKIAPENASSAALLQAGRTELQAVWEGRKYKIRLKSGIWAIQSRTKDGHFYHSFGRGPAKWAEEQFYRFMASGAVEKKKERNKLSRASVADLIEAYEEMPKRAAVATEKINVYRLQSIVRAVFKKEPKEVRDNEITSKTWAQFMALKQGGKLDLSTRRRENIGINAAVRQAASLFIKRLRPLYAERGIIINDDVSLIQWLPEPYVPPAKAADSDLVTAWGELRKTDLAMWLTIGLARFAGLRREEIACIRPEWLIRKKGVPYVQMMDRPDEGYQHKTGKPYLAMILNEELAQAIESLPEGSLVVNPAANREKWFASTPQAWAKKFSPGAKKPLHRLRGLYLDQYKEEQEEAIAAHQQALKRASQAAGHTTTRTTEKSYLTPEALKP